MTGQAPIAESCDFDQLIDRCQTDSIKWCSYPRDVLPLYAADMDFLSPAAIGQALCERVTHGIYGYPVECQELRELFAVRMQRLYGWQVAPEEIVFVPRIATGVSAACHVAATAGEGLLVPTPQYGLLKVFEAADFVSQEVALIPRADGQLTFDFDTLEAAVTERTRVFFLCSPHNPAGRVFTAEELMRIGELCLRRDLLICSDDVYSDLVFPGSRHVPIASLASEFADRTITLMGPGKTYNVAGLRCAMAVVQNPALRETFARVLAGMGGADVNVLGYVGTLAAYRHGDSWLDQVLSYLRSNREVVCHFVAERLPGIRMARPEGTYAAWLDCRQAGIPGNPAEFFLREARVALNDGLTFGKGGEGFVRLVFGSPQTMILEALERMSVALQRL